MLHRRRWFKLKFLQFGSTFSWNREKKRKQDNQKSNYIQKQSPGGVLKNITNFTGKNLYQSLLFNTVAGMRPATLSKKRLWQRCFPLNFAKVLKTLSVAASILKIRWFFEDVIYIFSCQGNLKYLSQNIGKSLPPE